MDNTVFLAVLSADAQFLPKAQSVSEETICSSGKRGSRPVLFSEGSQMYIASRASTGQVSQLPYNMFRYIFIYICIL